MRRAALTLITLLVSARAGVSQNSYPGEADSLKGIGAFGVVVEALGSAASKLNLTQAQLKTDVELPLRAAGLPVSEIPLPFVYLRLSVMDHQSLDLVAYTVELQFRALVLVHPSQRPAYATTWQSAGQGLLCCDKGTFVREIRESIRVSVDEFANDYLKMNPKAP